MTTVLTLVNTYHCLQLYNAAINLSDSRRSDAECRAVRSCSMKSPSNRNYISFIGIVGSSGSE